MKPLDQAMSRFFACAAVLICLGSFAPAQEAKPEKKGSEAAQTDTQDPAAAAAGSGLTAFGRQIPAQRPNLGIYIPSFSAGKKTSIVEAEVLTRIDDSRLRAEDMTIHLFGTEAKDNVTVNMPSATYNMSNQILRSNERSKVSRADFDLEGDALIFDTTTSQGRMSGNVRMVIHDVSSLVKKPDPAPEQKPAPADATAQPAAPSNEPASKAKP